MILKICVKENLPGKCLLVKCNIILIKPKVVIVINIFENNYRKINKKLKMMYIYIYI